MNNWRQKFGKYAIPNLTLYLIIGYAIGYLIMMVNQEFLTFLTLDPYKILHGQIWRVFTWVLIPPSSNNFLFVLLMLFCCYSIGNALERTWGTERYNLFFFLGIGITVLAAFVALGVLYLQYGAESVDMVEAASIYSISNPYSYAPYWMSFSTYYINISIYIVYAMTYPNHMVMLYFIIPVKMKWLGIFDGVYMGYLLLKGGTFTKLAVAAALLNCLIFYLMNIKGLRNPAQAKRYRDFQRSYQQGMNSNRSNRGPFGGFSGSSAGSASGTASRSAGSTAYGQARSNPYGSSGTPNMKAASSITRHKCAICGKTEVSDPNMEFRFCSKCNGNYEYCSTHLFSHTHVK